MDSQVNKYIQLHSGISNQLIPLISMIRVCDMFNYNLHVKYNRINSYNHTIVNNRTLRINDLLVINYNLSTIDTIPRHCIQCNCNWNIDKNTINDNEKTNNILYYNVCHMFGTSNDNIACYKPTPTKNIVTNNFLQELKTYARLIKPIDIIDNKVKDYINTLNHEVLGLHIRTLDGGFIEMYSENKLFNYIDEFIKNNKNWKIYVSTDNVNVESRLINRYGDRIIKLNNPFGNNYNDKFSDNNYGLMNAIYELFVLSKLNRLTGSAGSTFSLLSWLLSDNESLDYWNEM